MNVPGFGFLLLKCAVLLFNWLVCNLKKHAYLVRQSETFPRLMFNGNTLEFSSSTFSIHLLKKKVLIFLIVKTY